MSDPNIRKLVIPKLTYSKYCGKCKFCIKAEWNPNEGVKHGILIVYCCANGGLYIDHGKSICPHGVSYGVELGQAEEFSPEDWTERFKRPESLLYREEEEEPSDPQKRFGE